MTLQKYSGTWDFSKASHLLRRTTYGPSLGEIHQVEGLGLDGALDLILSDISLPDPPINIDYEEDPYVPIGATWINAPYTPQARMSGYRRRSIRAWMMERAFKKELNIREKMVLFWHNHFVVADIQDAKFLYRYINTIRKRATGNIRELTKEITIDPAMLRYLNGNQNTGVEPNENYARELLELFTVGKGALAGSGDYTTFTEKDVVAMARVLTGWRDVGFNSLTIGEISSAFRPNRHDTGNKELSHRFNNVTITNEGDQEYKTLIDVIFQSDHVANFIARKLYRWFVYYEIDDTVETEIIMPLSQIIRDNDYEIKPALRILLESEHFMDDERVGCMIKHPIDFLVSAFKSFDVPFPDSEFESYRLQLGLFQFSALLQMEIFGIPSVAGWKAFYQSPAFYQIWINSTTLPLRKVIVDALTVVGIEIRGSRRVKIDLFHIVDNLTDPFNPNNLINELASFMFPKPISDSQLTNIKNALIPGLPDFEWTEEYALYRDNPDDEEIKRTIEARLIILFNTMMNMPEYHLI
jgi:uncharacterized protein (DUF1800 family)